MKGRDAWCGRHGSEVVAREEDAMLGLARGHVGDSEAGCNCLGGFKFNI